MKQRNYRNIHVKCDCGMHNILHVCVLPNPNICLCIGRSCHVYSLHQKTLNPFKYLATNTPNTENMSGRKSRLSSLTERRKEITSDFEIKISRPIPWRV